MRTEGRRPKLSSLELQRALLALCCLSLTLAIVLPSISLDREIVNVLVVVDVTQSMNVLDYELDGRTVSRLTFAKHALRESLPRLPCGSRMGLGIFTEYRSFLLLTPVEVCANRRELAALIDGISGQMSWASGSQVAKALYSGLLAAKTLETSPALAFITDGHEAPPINPHYRPEFTGTAGEIKGIIVGAGGFRPLPIPKFDPDGQRLGFWGADEVQQTDPYTRGRESNVPGEQMVDTIPLGPVSPALQVTPGREHLSSLHEPYLKLLARETELAFARLTSLESLTTALTDRALKRSETVPTDLHWLPALAALLLVSALYLLAWVVKRR